MSGAQLIGECSVAIKSAMTPLGAIAVAVRGGKVTGVRFGHATEAASVAALRRSPGSSRRDAEANHDGIDYEADEQLAEDVLERLVQYAAGEQVDLRGIPVALDHLSAFQQRVVKRCRAIPAGERRTYGQLAAEAGSPGAARAVGQVMASNRVPLIVPCHRVVAAGGGLGGFSAPQGLAMKRRLLTLEAGALFD
jgi:methylated-DNA-[protein]-cysteine S-methyltransferase